MILTLQRVRKSSYTSATVITRAFPYLSIVAQVLRAARLLWHLEGGCSRCVNWTRFPPHSTLRVCVVGLVPNLTPLKMLTKMLTFFHMHRFCSNMAHFKGMEALISDPF